MEPTRATTEETDILKTVVKDKVHMWTTMVIEQNSFCTYFVGSIDDVFCYEFGS